jgi:hypothetical protein
MHRLQIMMAGSDKWGEPLSGKNVIGLVLRQAPFSIQPLLGRTLPNGRPFINGGVLYLGHGVEAYHLIYLPPVPLPVLELWQGLFLPSAY